MSLQNYVLQVLIEENPWVDCGNFAERQIAYDDLAFLIADDYPRAKDKAEMAEQHILNEFGKEGTSQQRIDRVKARMRAMFGSDEIKQEFNYHE